jgi:tetratricopeptide (TPR) repeat protein
MNDVQADSGTKENSFSSIYSRRERASLDDARSEAEAVLMAIDRISKGVDESSSDAERDLAAGKLFEIANEIVPAETAYRRAAQRSTGMEEARARLVVVLLKQRRFDEAIELGTDLFSKDPAAVFKSLVYQGPLSMCTIMGDAYRLSGNHTVAAGFYREAVRTEVNSPYAATRAVISMALSGQSHEIEAFSRSAPVVMGERMQSLIRLSREANRHRPIIEQVARRGDVAGAESMGFAPLWAVDPAAVP